MRVNIEAQCLCVQREEIRGIPYYTLELLKNLTERGQNEYSVSFFDFNRERNNRAFITEYCADMLDKLKIYECNDLSYLTILDCLRKDDHSLYNKRTYEDYIKCESDVYHFPHSIQFPDSIPQEKTVITVHDIIPIVNEHIQKAAPDFCLRFGNALKLLERKDGIPVITDSASTKDDLLTYTDIKEERITVIPIAYNRNLYYPDRNEGVLKKYGIKKPYVLYLGALDPRKGIDVLLEALNYLKKPDYQIVLAGPSVPVWNARELVEQSRHKDSVVFTGYVSDDEKRALLSQAEIFVFPSFYEGFGLPVLEAMACETPVITTNASSLPEVGGDAVIYMSPGDAEGLADAVEKLLSDSVLRDDLISRGKQQCSLFSWEETARQTEELYRSIA